ncbi:putative flippase GtrA [Elusimicrobium simillimum]|uniref:GtrA family protein n=1 Tax=Elusimicrobium simillimum TaxID=3143438 RepID=UPI003C6EBAA7
MRKKILALTKFKFFRFMCVGVLNTMFGYGMYALFIFLGMHYTLAVLCSTFLGILFNFKTIGVLVFKNGDNRLIFRFFAVYGLIYAINVFCLKLLKLQGFQNMYINGLVLVIPLALLSFTLNKFFVFERGKNENICSKQRL